MPFTPIHMGPGILVKAILQGSFSLLVFGWTQILMDIQPLLVMLTGEGHLHGFSHTYIGGSLIAVFAALTGKYLAQLGLKLLRIGRQQPMTILWHVAFLSGFIGSFSHVLLDSIMHTDVEPFFPVVLSNPFYGLVSVAVLHKICLYSGLFGTAIYFLVSWRASNN